MSRQQNANRGSPRGTSHQAEMAPYLTKKLQDELQAVGFKIRKHEENLNFLKSEMNKLDESFLDMQILLGKNLLASGDGEKSEDLSGARYEEMVRQQILKNDKTAAAIFLQFTSRYRVQASIMPEMKDVIGIIALLGKVDDDNLSWRLSEYLGMEKMLAIVCKTIDGVQGLEKYDKEGRIDASLGIHGLGAYLGTHFDGRCNVICLESLRPYPGKIVSEHPQRKLDLLNPRLPNGETPSGFLGFAVNMINLDEMHLLGVTKNGDGLRETLFYHLFSSLQVYKTREEMFQAVPFISMGALSLDGGIIKSNGVITLGRRVGTTNVTFPKSSERLKFFETNEGAKNRIKEIKWLQESVREDMQKEQEMLTEAKLSFDTKRRELIEFIAHMAPHQP